jgi:hypothetical protein
MIPKGCRVGDPGRLLLGRAGVPEFAVRLLSLICALGMTASFVSIFLPAETLANPVDSAGYAVADHTKHQAGEGPPVSGRGDVVPVWYVVPERLVSGPDERRFLVEERVRPRVMADRTVVPSHGNHLEARSHEH